MLIRGITITIGLIILWQIIVMLTGMPSFILPTPWQVAQVFYQHAPLLVQQTWPTLIETVLGLAIGVGFGMLGALALAICRPARLWFLPILVVSQAIPTIAIAPLLVIWLGYGIASKVATSAIMIFFPVTTAFYDGLKRSDPIWLEVAKTMQAKPWRILWNIKIPAALPQLGSGLRVAAAIAPIGAVIGEWVGSSRGLGYLIINANARLQIDMMFSAILIIMVLTLALYFSVDKLLKHYVYW